MAKQVGSTRNEHGRVRVVISGVSPEIECGRFPIKRVIGEVVTVEADIFSDGHEVLGAALLWKHCEDEQWTETRMEPLVNDRWRGSFVVEQLGVYVYTLSGWVDHFNSWRHDLEKKVKAGLDVSVELLAGAGLVEAAAERAPAGDARRLRAWAKEINAKRVPMEIRSSLALEKEVSELAARYADRHLAGQYRKELSVIVDPPLARFGAWYEMFPRSFSPEPGRHGTFKDCIAQLPRIAKMGFNILYFPPIHPIGRSFRKGKNNHPKAEAGEPGSPWGIGAREGGHKAIHPELGTMKDFQELLKRAREHEIEVALDIALQCSPEHPYVREHPEWFRKRPDGSIQYAENPPKKYQDIYPLDFETDDWNALWQEMKSIFEFWIKAGVKIFRVDNPHTKPFAFWEWCLSELKSKYPDTIYLAEAFTRPKIMYRLAKLGFTQSYTYFAWRNTSRDLAEYLNELTQTEVREYFRPNLWPNTPDILNEYLQKGGRPAFIARLILAATLGASYGIYGPAFELCESHPYRPGSEEYLNSEKYEIKQWDLYAPDNLTSLISRLNQIRRENPCLHSNDTLRFHGVDHPQLLVYSKHTPDFRNTLIVAVNLDPFHAHHGWTALDLPKMGMEPGQPFLVHDLLTGSHHLWKGTHNYIELRPHELPAHILRVYRRPPDETQQPPTL
jgi:starch synthase (maltosyl-transferring)